MIPEQTELEISLDNFMREVDAKMMKKSLSEKISVELENLQYHYSMVGGIITQIKMLLHHLKKEQEKGN